MKNPSLILILVLGAILMCVIVALQMKKYHIAQWKSLVVSTTLVLTGLIGSRIWYYIENGAFTGRSFYGAIFLSIIVFFPLAKILRISYAAIMDFVAPGGCLTLSLVKVQCLYDGCCAGKVLCVDENYDYVKFPSQIVEMIAFLLIAVILLIVFYNGKKTGRIFPWFMLLYGGSRFGLDFMRGSTVPYALGLSAGSFWSLILFVMGFLVMAFLCYRDKEKCSNEQVNSVNS